MGKLSNLYPSVESEGNPNVNSEVISSSGNWNDVYSTVQTNSGSWSGGSGNTEVNDVVIQTSGNWNSVYSTVQTNSGSWSGGGGNTEVNEVVIQTSGNWNDVYSTVQTNSGIWEGTNAVHIDIADEFSAAPSGTPTLSSRILWEDETDGYNKKSSTFDDLFTEQIVSITDTEVSAFPTFSGIKGQEGYYNNQYYKCISTNTWIKWNDTNKLIEAEEVVIQTSGNWNSVYSTVQTNSGSWSGGGGGGISPICYLVTSGDVDNSYFTMNEEATSPENVIIDKIGGIRQLNANYSGYESISAYAYADFQVSGTSLDRVIIRTLDKTLSNSITTDDVLMIQRW